MKKLAMNLFVLGVITFGFTSCENENVNEEIAEIEFEISKTDKGDISGPGSGDDDDDDEL